MKNYKKNSVASVLIAALALGFILPTSTLAAGPAPVNLLSAGNFTILAETAITTTAGTSIVGDIGISPNAASSITGFGLILDGSGTFSTSALITGKVYAANYTPPTPTTMTTAVNDMMTAYTDAAGRAGPTATELGAGNIGGMALAPGLYKWSTGVTIPTNVTLSGGPDDVWIFQIAGDLGIASAGDLASGIKVVLTGGAQAANVFWQVAGPTGATLGTYSTFNGNILSAKQIIVQTGAVLNGRALAQTQVTLDANAVSGVTACDAVTQIAVSDTANNTVATGGAPAVTVTPHVAWTATIPGSTTWIWETGPTSVDEVVAFEQSFTVSGTVLLAQLDIASDNSYKVFIDAVEVAADASENNFQLATQDSHNLTANVTPGTHTLRIEVKNQGAFDASANPAGLLYKFTIITCPTPPPADVTVTIVKYVDGQHANSTSAEGQSFPMQASWNATNIGAGSGSFSLAPVGFNNPNPYEATTANMSSGADYSTNEVTSGSSVGASCTEGKPFALVGYTTGGTEAAAFAATPTTTSPSFTNLLTNKYIIVWNKDCTPKLTLNKIVVNDNTGTQPESAWTLTATGPTPISGPGAVGSTDVQSGPAFAPGTYTLSESTGPAGYTASTWSCVKNGGSPVSGSSIVLASGDSVICTITNDANILTPPPPETACNTPTIVPSGFTLQSGTTGNDSVALSPNTMFVGNGGNDKVTAGNGDYIICTGSGNDKITTGNGNVTIDSGDGNNAITTGTGNGTIIAGLGNDKITTGTGDHTINGGGGNNDIVTGDGTQNVTTGSGNDKITTGSGNDVISAGDGNNKIDAGNGGDTATAGSGNDKIDGGTGTDSCNAGGGNNTLTNCP